MCPLYYKYIYYFVIQIKHSPTHYPPKKIGLSNILLKHYLKKITLEPFIDQVFF